MKRLIALAVTGTLVAACGSMAMKGPAADAIVEPTKGNTAVGNVTFTQKDGKVLVTARLTGLAPGNHGFHIHEKGDCSSQDGMSAGAHFNPLGKPHAAPTTPDRHTGDMPMLVAEANGNANTSFELDVMTIGSGQTDIIGRSVIIHKDPDDFTTQPTGNSGARVACGVIKKA